MLSPVQPGSLALIKQWFTQIAQQFPSPWVHIGADETNELGKGQTKDLVAQRGLDQVYVDFLRQIHDAIQPTGKRVLFWGDLAWHNPGSRRRAAQGHDRRPLGLRRTARFR